MLDAVRQSIVSLAEKNAYISYADLHQALGTKSEREVEDALIEAIYEGVVDGRLDPKAQIFEVHNWQASVPEEPQKWAFVKAELEQWIGHTKALVGTLTETAALSNQHAAANKAADEAHEKEVEKQREAHANTKGGHADSDHRPLRNGAGSRRKLLRRGN
ncbi:PCI domain-containing protein [Aphelenchoides fujianensis]|nr:PCI domain-containing protein [Aphelenchoides fujianensis]